MKIEKMTLKRFLIFAITACSFLLLLGALSTPILQYYKIDISQGLYIFYSNLCSHNVANHFYLNGYNIPLCANCLGILSGVLVTMILYLEQIKIDNNIYYTFGALGFGEFILEYFKIINPQNWVTLIAGIFIGIFSIITLLRLEIKLKKNY